MRIRPKFRVNLVNFVFYSTVSRKKFSRKIGFTDTYIRNREMISVVAERTDPNARLIIYTSIRVQNSSTASAD
jgi:hypothetical protein